MSEEARNVAILREAYGQWRDSAGGTSEGWLALCADHCTIASLADGAPGAEFTAARRSKDEIRQYLEGIAADWEMIRYDFDEFIAQGDRVVAIGAASWRNKRTGKRCDTPKIDVWRLEDGKAVSYAEYYDTAKMFAAAT